MGGNNDINIITVIINKRKNRFEIRSSKSLSSGYFGLFSSSYFILLSRVSGY